MEIDIQQIIIGCIAKDRLMQKRLYEINYPEMMKVCRRYASNTDIAAGLYNDAMLKVFHNIHSYKEEGKIIGWIKRIVVNTCIDFVRLQTPFETKPLDANVADYMNIDNDVLQKLSNNEIRKIILEIPKQLATVFNLFVYEAYNHTEIGEILKIPSGTSRYYLSEARKLLQERITKNYLIT